MAGTALATKQTVDPEFAKLYLKAKYDELLGKADPILSNIGDARKTVAVGGKSQYDSDPSAQQKRLSDAQATIARLAPAEERIYAQLGLASKLVSNTDPKAPFNQAAIDKQFLQLANGVEDIKVGAGFTKKLPPAPVTANSFKSDINQLAARSREQQGIFTELLDAPQLDAKKTWLPPESFGDRVKAVTPSRVYLNTIDKVFGLPQLGPKERAELSAATTALGQKQEALALTAAALKAASGEKVTAQDLAPAGRLLRQVAGDKVLSEAELQKGADHLNSMMAVVPGTKLSDAQIARRFNQLTGQDFNTLGRQIRGENSAATVATTQLKDSANKMLGGLNNAEAEIVFALASWGALKTATSKPVVSFAKAAGREMLSTFLDTPNALRAMANSIGNFIFPEIGADFAVAGGGRMPQIPRTSAPPANTFLKTRSKPSWEMTADEYGELKHGREKWKNIGPDAQNAFTNSSQPAMIQAESEARMPFTKKHGTALIVAGSVVTTVTAASINSIFLIASHAADQVLNFGTVGLKNLQEFQKLRMETIAGASDRHLACVEVAYEKEKKIVGGEDIPVLGAIIGVVNQIYQPQKADNLVMAMPTTKDEDGCHATAANNDVLPSLGNKVVGQTSDRRIPTKKP